MTFLTETYGPYEIKSGPLTGRWGANAFKRKLVVAKATGASRDEAVSAVKAELARLKDVRSSERDAEGVPPASVYKEAFVMLLPDFPDGYVAMLRAHFAAQDHMISATKLAQAAGYAGYEGANLHYGKLGWRVAQEVGFVPPRRLDGTPIWTCAIARDRAVDSDVSDEAMIEALSRAFETGHYEWEMRPQVVEALRALGW